MNREKTKPNDLKSARRKICRGCKKDCPSILRHLKNQKSKSCIAQYKSEDMKQFEYESNQINKQCRNKEKDKELRRLRYLKNKKLKLNKGFQDTSQQSFQNKRVYTNINQPSTQNSTNTFLVQKDSDNESFTKDQVHNAPHIITEPVQNEIDRKQTIKTPSRVKEKISKSHRKDLIDKYIYKIKCSMNSFKDTFDPILKELKHNCRFNEQETYIQHIVDQQYKLCDYVKLNLNNAMIEASKIRYRQSITEMFDNLLTSIENSFQALIRNMSIATQIWRIYNQNSNVTPVKSNPTLSTNKGKIDPNDVVCEFNAIEIAEYHKYKSEIKERISKLENSGLNLQRLKREIEKTLQQIKESILSSVRSAINIIERNQDLLYCLECIVRIYKVLRQNSNIKYKAMKYNVSQFEQFHTAKNQNTIINKNDNINQTLDENNLLNSDMEQSTNTPLNLMDKGNNTSKSYH